MLIVRASAGLVPMKTTSEKSSRPEQRRNDATLLQRQGARARPLCPELSDAVELRPLAGMFPRLSYPFIPEINPDPMRPISHSPNGSTQVPWSGAYPRRARPYPPEDPPRHCREACHKMHTFTTLTSDDQWIGPSRCSAIPPPCRCCRGT